MTSYTLADLATLGTPSIVEQLDYEVILSRRKAKFVALMAAKGVTIDVTMLESEPAVALLEESSYEEVLLRARGNDIALARYLFWAQDSAVDHMAAFYDLQRLPGELDDRLKVRIILALQARSTGGTEARYKLGAMSASLRVADVSVYVVAPSPVVNVAIFAADNAGIADQSLIDVVSVALNDPAFKMINDTLTIRSAVVLVQPVVAALTLLPLTALSVIDDITAALPGNWAAVSGLGRDLTLNWLMSQLMQPGVYGATIATPLAPVIMPPYQAVRIGTVSLTFAGRSY